MPILLPLLTIFIRHVFTLIKNGATILPVLFTVKRALFLTTEFSENDVAIRLLRLAFDV